MYHHTGKVSTPPETQMARSRKRTAFKFDSELKILGDGSTGSKYWKLKNQGFGDRQICKALGIPYHALLRWKKRVSILKPRPHLHLEVSEYFELAKSFQTEGAIASHLGVSSKTLWRWKKKNGVEPRLKRYPPTPEQIPAECLDMMENLSPLLENIRVDDIRDDAGNRLVRCVWRFYCKAQEGQPLDFESQRKYFRKVIHRCFINFRRSKQELKEVPRFF